MKKIKTIIRECSDCNKKGDQTKLFFFIVGDTWSCLACCSKNTEIVESKKKKKQKPTYNGIEFDSPEEIEMYQWCEEAKNADILIDFIYQPPSYTLSTKQTYEVQKQLKTKVRIDERELLKPHIFTADFMLISNIKHDFFRFKINYDTNFYESTIDIKGNFSQFHDGKLFAVNQKWLYDKHGVYVNKVIPEELFKKTWVPENARRTPAKQQLKKKYIGFPSIGDYLNGA